MGRHRGVSESGKHWKVRRYNLALQVRASTRQEEQQAADGGLEYPEAWYETQTAKPAKD